MSRPLHDRVRSDCWTPYVGDALRDVALTMEINGGQDWSDLAELLREIESDPIVMGILNRKRRTGR